MQETLCSPEQPPSVILRTNRGRAVEQLRSAGSTRCRLPPLAVNHSQKKYLILARLKAEELLRRARMKRFGKDKITQKKLIPNTQPSPGIRALLLQLPGCHAFCKKDCKKHARQPCASTRRRSEVNRSSRNSGKSPCRCTGKANIQTVARRLREKVGPPLYRSGAGLHAASCNLPAVLSRCLLGKTASSPRQSLATLNHSDKPLRGQKPSPVGRAEDMPVCLFAQGPFASAEYLVQLTSSLAQKVCLGIGKPLSPRGMAEKPSTQPAGKGASSWSSQNIKALPAPHTAS